MTAICLAEIHTTIFQLVLVKFYLSPKLYMGYFIFFVLGLLQCFQC